MENVAEKGSRTLDASADLKDLLRLAHEALHRIQQEVHGNCYDATDNLSLKLHDIRRDADQLSEKIDQYVRDSELQAYG
jgi:hypothetical protein